MPSYPIAPKRPHPITQHDQTRNDNYFWLRNREDPEVMKFLTAQMDYLEERMGYTKPLQDSLFAEMKGRIQETDSTVPEKRGGYWYYVRTEAGMQYPIYCRKKESLENPEEILLDQNALGEGKPFCSVGAVSVSPDGNKLAYSFDFEGNETFTIRIMDLVSGKHFDESIPNTSGSVYELGGVEWANDNKHIFYITLDSALRPDKFYRHKIGTDATADTLLFHETDESFFLWMHKSRDDKFIMTYHYSTTTREMRFIDADKPESELRVVQPRIEGLEYFAAHHKGMFFIVNNENARNFKVSAAPVENSGRENWKELLLHREDTLVEGVSTFENFIIVRERKDGLQQLRICAPDDLNKTSYVRFPEPAYQIEFAENSVFETDIVRFYYSSLVTPHTVVDFHMDSGEWETRKTYKIDGYDQNDFVTERIFAAAEDGTRIPISIAYKKSVKFDGLNPTLLHGYGAYGANMDVDFSSNRVSLLDRGFVFAIGHVRGGSEMGRAWYENGKLQHKKNSFTDLIACAERLIEAGFTSKEKLAIYGVSAGGLLVTASMVMRPDLFGAVIAKVPFVDVINSLSDPTIPLTTLEYNEWGNPANKEQYEYMMSYSPYDNLQAREYPHLLLTGGFNDPRVAYWEPAKFAAKLSELKSDDNLLLLKTNFNAGHAGASGRYDFMKEVAFEFTFLIEALQASRTPLESNREAGI
ncbi:MAG: oligopeptidase B [Anaerolineae bacterium]|nr:MAG: oligopeptidase B [Anaerolineae bacterium]WKZ42988.1 MAG: S9 family peptidase [Anaerolineales bacterium]